ncbi:unnamed protein product [Spodoptera exigua]|nr:unnamed protein product [Spodoptera exigua]
MHLPWHGNCYKFVLRFGVTSSMQEVKSVAVQSIIETMARTVLFLVRKSEEFSYDSCNYVVNFCCGVLKEQIIETEASLNDSQDENTPRFVAIKSTAWAWARRGEARSRLTLGEKVI